MRNKRQMMAIEFDSIRPLLNISDDRIQAARSALVDNETYQAVANRYGWTRQAVGDSVDAVWRTLLKYRETQNVAANANVSLPTGWERVELVAPSTMIAKFRMEIDQASRSQTGKPKPAKKIVST
jgi:imidazole glycerol phosphate synthase subunit HisF